MILSCFIQRMPWLRTLWSERARKLYPCWRYQSAIISGKSLPSLHSECVWMLPFHQRAAGALFSAATDGKGGQQVNGCGCEQLARTASSHESAPAMVEVVKRGG